MTKVEKLIKQGASIEAIVAAAGQAAAQAERKAFKALCLEVEKQARRNAKAAEDLPAGYFEYYSGIVKAALDLAALIK